MINKGSFLLLLVLFFSSEQGFAAKLVDLKFNEDVFLCGESVKTLYKTEMSLGVYLENKGDISPSEATLVEALAKYSKDLGKLSPKRAAFLQEVSNKQNPHVQFKRGIKIVRVSPPANIVLPDNCLIDIMADVTITKTHYKVIINEDLFDRLAIDDQVYFWSLLALNLEQGIFKFIAANYIPYEVEFNQLQGREFLACWYSSTCRPLDIPSFHQLALKKDYALYFLEQSGIAIPQTNNYFIINKESGLVDRTMKIAQPENYSLTKSFNSQFALNGSTHKLSSAYYNDRNSLGGVDFDRDGLVKCVRIESLKFPDAPGVEKLIYGQKVSFESSSFGTIIFPLCWNQEGKFTQGRILLFKDKPFLVPINGEMINISNYNENTDRFSYAMSMAFYENEKPHWLDNYRGTLKFNGREIKLLGAIKLFPSGRIQCLTPTGGQDIYLANGSKIHVTYDDALLDLYCFNEDGSFDQMYDYFKVRGLMAKDFYNAY